jgi:hypothetical protein
MPQWLLILDHRSALPLGDHLLYTHRYVLSVCNRGLRAAPCQKVQPLIAAGLHVAHDHLGQHVAGNVVYLRVAEQGSRVTLLSYQRSR